MKKKPPQILHPRKLHIIKLFQITKYGMAKNLGPLYLPDNKRLYSKALGDLIDHEARQMVSETYRKTEQLLQENRDKLTKVLQIVNSVFENIY